MAKAPSIRVRSRKPDRGTLRIIGGRWRGRRFGFTAIPGLRPTPDRVRETLFNWLRDKVAGSRCLDLFAGSGSLSLEALSRGADSVTALDSSALALRELRTTLSLLDTQQAELVHTDTPRWLANCRGRHYDLVFIDPPFDSQLAECCLQLLAVSPILAPGALVYLESSALGALIETPSGWSLHREARAGDVCYRLFRVGA